MMYLLLNSFASSYLSDMVKTYAPASPCSNLLIFPDVRTKRNERQPLLIMAPNYETVCLEDLWTLNPDMKSQDIFL